MNQEIDEEKPGLAQYYCVHCTRYFISLAALQTHFKTKEHKKRVKTCKEIPYSHEEAERAGGLHPNRIRFTDAVYAGKTQLAQIDEKDLMVVQ